MEKYGFLSMGMYVPGYLAQLVQCRKPLYNLPVTGNCSQSLLENVCRTMWKTNWGSSRMRSSNPPSLPSYFSPYLPLSNPFFSCRAAGMSCTCTNVYKHGVTAMPPAGHLHGAEIQLHRAPGAIPWGRKVSDASSLLSDTTCLMKIMHQSGCNSKVGWCLIQRDSG